MGNTQAVVQQEKIKAERRRRTRKRCKGERVYVWHNAQLDVNAPPAKEIPRPVLLDELEGKTITQIWAGFVYACATAEGDLHILKIPLKDPTSNNTAPLDPEVFGVVQTLAGNVASFDGACLNGSHLAAITNDGQVAVWGRGAEGEIGNGSWQDARVPTLAYVPGTYRPSFPFDRFWTKQSVVSLSCGDGHMIALRSDGEVFVWGYNVARQCGPETSDIRYPRALSDWWTLPSEDGGVVQVSAGYCKNYLLTSTGAVFGWGRNREAELGVGECPLATVRMPTRLDLPPCRFINAGPHNCGAITFTEDIYTWGLNNAGALGLGTNLRVVSVPSPVEIEDFENVHKRDLALGTANSVVVLENGALYVTGQVEDWRGNVFTFVKELAEEHVVRASCDAVSIMVLCGGEEVMSLKELCIEHVKERRRELGPQLDRLPIEIKRAILSD